MNSTEWIPNIVIGQDYDDKYADQSIHYDQLHNLASHFGYDMPVHRHAQYLQVHYINEGECSFHIDEKIFQTEGPACFFTPPSIPHSFLIENETRGHVLTLHQSVLWRLIKNGLQPLLHYDRLQGISVEKRNVSADNQQNWLLLENTFKDFSNEWDSDHMGKSMALESLSQLIILRILRLAQQPTNAVSINSDDMRLFHRFSEHIERQFNHQQHLPFYLQAIGVSESKLNQVCRKIAHRTPKRLIHDRVILEIKRLLVFTNLSVNEICYQTGFNDPAYFSRFFKRLTGVTALAYRRDNT